jgi:hypothetical protein
MVSTESWDELHKFAQEMGLKREWFQEKGELSHYDLTSDRAKIRALKLGAELVHPREIIQALNELKPPA